MKICFKILAILFLSFSSLLIGCGSPNSETPASVRKLPTTPEENNPETSQKKPTEELKTREPVKTTHSTLWQLRFLRSDEQLVRSVFDQQRIELNSSLDGSNTPARILPEFAEPDYRFKTLLGSEHILREVLEKILHSSNKTNRQKIYKDKLKLADRIYQDPNLDLAEAVVHMTGTDSLCPYNKALLLNNKSSKTALFLGDDGGISDSCEDVSHYSLASMLQHKGFGKESGVCLWKTDIDFKNSPEAGANSIQLLKLDITHEFALGDQIKFDVIAMRNGLCFCNTDSTSCGGLEFKYSYVDTSDNEVTFDKQPVKEFLNRVASRLNLENQDSFALLHGLGNQALRFGNASSERLKFWYDIASECESEFNSKSHEHKVSIQVVTNRNGSFFALLIKPNLSE